MERSVVSWLLGYAVDPTAFPVQPHAPANDPQPSVPWVQVRRLESRLRCEASGDCVNPQAVNLLGDHFDLSLCREHALDLSTRLQEAVDLSEPSGE